MSGSSLKGVVLIGPEIPSFSAAQVHVFLEDVSRLDASAQCVARQTIAPVDHEAGHEQRIAFALACDALDQKASYTVRAHVALHGAEEVRTGDCVTTQSFPVSAADRQADLTVRVHRVT